MALTVEREACSSSCSGWTRTLHGWNVPSAAISTAAAPRALRAGSAATPQDHRTLRFHMTMRVLVLGSGGMLGRAVVRAAARHGHDVAALARAELDITDATHVARVVAAAEPRAVINCAAFTDVDGAETNEAWALRVNGEGAGNVARAAAEAGARVVHVSTDYVFDGTKREPWLESDPVGPLQAYGRSKLAGERAVAAGNAEHAVVRTAWLFDAGGPPRARARRDRRAHRRRRGVPRGGRRPVHLVRVRRRDLPPRRPTVPRGADDERALRAPGAPAGLQRARHRARAR